ncbi:MAG: hypothetical protein P1U53_11090 [Sulfitobacter sp.]|nr:hypothetical protein [Sulfitobacter sp.]
MDYYDNDYTDEIGPELTRLMPVRGGAPPLTAWDILPSFSKVMEARISEEEPSLHLEAEEEPSLHPEGDEEYKGIEDNEEERTTETVPDLGGLVIDYDESGTPWGSDDEGDDENKEEYEFGLVKDMANTGLN